MIIRGIPIFHNISFFLAYLYEANIIASEFNRSATAIASAYTQGAEIKEVVKSRLKYAFVAAGFSVIMFIAIMTGWGHEFKDEKAVKE